MAKAIEREQADAEDLRLLYVAATRVREKLIVCGHRQDRSSNIWLDMLASAAGLDLGLLVSQPGEWQTRILPGSQQAVRGMAQGVQPIIGEVAIKREEPVTASDATSLYLPLIALEAEHLDQKQQDGMNRERRLRRVVGRHHRPEGTVLGTLVHAAIRRWRFPGDPGLEELLRAEALMEGLVDQEEREITIAQAKDLLSRFRADARFSEIDTSQRRHEIPYSIMTDNGLPSTGAIDLIYQGKDARWQIVDFKTDDIQTDAEFSELKENYTKQIIRYRESFQRLLGQPAKAWLCFLNYASAVRWEQV